MLVKSWWRFVVRSFLRITVMSPRKVPIAPAMTINLTLSTIGGLKLFDQVFAITGGGPGYSTETLSTLIYKQAFVFGSYGYSTAVALVLAILVAAVSLVQLKYLRSREVAG